MRRLACVAVAAFVIGRAPDAGAATLSGAVRMRGTAVRDAVVYLERAAGPAPLSAPTRVVMDQKNLAFVPWVLPVVRGTIVEFTNSDDIQHNVFSPSRVAGAFDLGSYSRGETRSVVMTEPGEVLVLCNIHMEMEGHIIVVRDPFFATTDGDGRYRIVDVPPDRYAVRVWRDKWLARERTIEVTDSPTMALDLDL
jgi:plastocyanin